MPSPDTLSHLSVYAGVAATVLGAGAVAPEATRAALMDEPRALARAVGGFIWYRVLRRPQVIVGSAGAVGVRIRLSGSASVVVTRTPPVSGVDERLAWSEAQILDLWHHVQGLEVSLKQALEQLRTSLSGMDLELSRQVGAIESQMKEAESTNVRLNARAFPVIALGAVLGGLPDVFGQSLWVLLPAFLVTALYTFGAVRAAWGSELRRLLQRCWRLWPGTTRT